VVVQGKINYHYKDLHKWVFHSSYPMNENNTALKKVRKSHSNPFHYIWFQDPKPLKEDWVLQLHLPCSWLKTCQLLKCPHYDTGWMYWADSAVYQQHERNLCCFRPFTEFELLWIQELDESPLRTPFKVLFWPFSAADDQNENVFANISPVKVMHMGWAQDVEPSVYTQNLTRCPTMVCTAFSFTKAIPQVS